MKAWTTAAVFSSFLLLDLYYLAPHTSLLVPHTILYALLVLNTFFSVRFFSSILRFSALQVALDAVLAPLYLALALAMGYSLLFPLIAALLFLIACGKYAVALSDTHRDVLRIKIMLNMIGVGLCVAGLLFAIAGYAEISSWALVVIFVASTSYIIFFDRCTRSNEHLIAKKH